MQCQECKYWMHYKCTDLPEYQLLVQFGLLSGHLLGNSCLLG